MQKKYLIANWKMQLDLDKSIQLAKKFLKLAKKSRQKSLEIILCPSFTSLPAIAKIFKRKKIKLGGQNIFWKSKGAFTGEISVLMLKEFGCEYVIIGHSERRRYLQETDEMVNNKVITCLQNGLIPILCVGESFIERQESKKDLILTKQLTTGLKNVKLEAWQKIIIAYEPVWVIGSGQAVDPQEAGESLQIVKQALRSLYTFNQIEQNFDFVYGGSSDSKNIQEFLNRDLVDGFLVGTASLNEEEFGKMIELT